MKNLIIPVVIGTVLSTPVWANEPSHQQWLDNQLQLEMQAVATEVKTQTLMHLQSNNQILLDLEEYTLVASTDSEIVQPLTGLTD